MKTTATSISQYLADIGRKGGQKIRRHLSSEDSPKHSVRHIQSHICSEYVCTPVESSMSYGVAFD